MEQGRRLLVPQTGKQGGSAGRRRAPAGREERRHRLEGAVRLLRALGARGDRRGRGGARRLRAQVRHHVQELGPKGYWTHVPPSPISRSCSCPATRTSPPPRNRTRSCSASRTSVASCWRRPHHRGDAPDDSHRLAERDDSPETPMPCSRSSGASSTNADHHGRALCEARARPRFARSTRTTRRSALRFSRARVPARKLEGLSFRQNRHSTSSSR